METRNQSNIVLVLACFGVVLYHLLGNEEFYIGNDGGLNLKTLQAYYLANGFFYTVFECIKGSTAIVGVFLINSGYGLYKQSKNQTPLDFYKKRITKIWIYCLLCGIVCTLIVLSLRGEFIYSYIYSLLPVFGFYELPREGFVIQYWYLALIFSYYLIFPWLKKVIDTKAFFYSVLISALIGYLIIYDIYTTTSIYHSSMCRLSEFCFGIFLAKNQKAEKYFFEFKFIKTGIALLILLLGYAMFYDIRFTPFPFLFFSVGVYFLGVQIASLLVSNSTVVKLFSRLKGGTMSVYLLHLLFFPTAVKVGIDLIGLIFKIEESYILSFVLVLALTIFSLFIFNIIETNYYRLFESTGNKVKANMRTFHLQHIKK